MSETLSRGEIQDRLAGMARKDPSFRAALLKDPKAVVQGHLDVKIPETIRIKAVEETADTVYVIVPYVPQPGTDLDDASLERVAGGGGKMTKRQLDKLFGGGFTPDPERADPKPD